MTSMGSPKALESGSFKGSEAPAGGEPPAGDDVRRTGTRLTAVAHIVTAVIGAGVLALPYSTAVLGWVAGPLLMLVCAAITLHNAGLLANCHVIDGKRQSTYTDCVRAVFGRKGFHAVGWLQHSILTLTAIAYTITAATSLQTVSRSICDAHGTSPDACFDQLWKWVLIFSAAQLLLAQAPNLHHFWWASAVAAACSFGYSLVAFGVSAAAAPAATDSGSVGGMSFGSPTEKAFQVLNAGGAILFAFSFAMVLVEIQDTVKAPEAVGEKKAGSVNQVMISAVRISVGIVTAFYMAVACAGYAALGDATPTNILSGFTPAQAPYWVTNLANCMVLLHMLPAYQVFSLPFLCFVEAQLEGWQRWPRRLTGWRLRLVWRTIYVAVVAFVAVLMPFFGYLAGLIGSLSFWPLSAFFPIEMYIRLHRPGPRRRAALRALSAACLVGSCLGAIGSIRLIIGSWSDFKLFGAAARATPTKPAAAPSTPLDARYEQLLVALLAAVKTSAAQQNEGYAALRALLAEAPKRGPARLEFARSLVMAGEATAGGEPPAGDDVRRTGTRLTAVAHIVTAVIGAGVLALPYSTAVLGWVAGPLLLLVCAAITLYNACLMADCHVIDGKRQSTYTDCVRAVFGRKGFHAVGWLQHSILTLTAIAYTITAATSLQTVSRSICDAHGTSPDACFDQLWKWVLIFSAAQLLLAQAPNLHHFWWASAVAAACSFGYSLVAFGVSAAAAPAATDSGSVGGMSFGTPTEKAFQVLNSGGTILFAFGFVTVLIEIQDTVKAPEAVGEKKAGSVNQVMISAVRISVGIVTAFYMAVACAGYAALGDATPTNILSGFTPAQAPYWVTNLANCMVLLHMLPAYQVFSLPFLCFVEAQLEGWQRWPRRLTGWRLRLVWRTIYVAVVAFVAVLMPFFGYLAGLIGSLSFWPLSAFFPIEMYIRLHRPGPRRRAALRALSAACLVGSCLGAIGSIRLIIGAWSDFKLFGAN
ncbi:amino acid permease 4-like [Micractinium conductrix]|uniref:Amino acid permease 4-like n=1 Tax=Micractinium conductrix TaxID=554055 RepID=A0A2P6VRF9_9CHLO|nr:amino acid permease 4-like [Micractinium conductrix]|eukprot:PSC76661.1 amino acid permease 4-like [Micractinium conductrix]